MGRIFVTGDTHGDISIQKIKYFKKIMVTDLTRDDILIVCGDMGICWDGDRFDKYIQTYWSQQPMTVLFIDGNHENFDVLTKYPITEKWGGKVQQITENVYHLMRGEIYNIYDKTFFAFGGAASHDKHCRKEGISWWPQEMPSQEEYENGIRSLECNNYSVDFVITHSVDKESLKLINPHYETDSLNQFFNIVKNDIEYSHWFCGHYHLDGLLPNNITLIYNKIVQIL